MRVSKCVYVWGWFPRCVYEVVGFVKRVCGCTCGFVEMRKLVSRSMCQGLLVL